MPNFQPNYIYSPLYGNRYLGGSRAHAPSTGSAGQVENTAVQRAATVGVPYVAPQEVSQGQPIGWSGTGRDQSAVSSLGNFGFVPRESLVQPGVMDTTDTYFDVPELDSTGSFQVPTTGESTIPSFSYGDESDNSVGTDYGQGILPDSSIGMDLAWNLYDLGANAPIYSPGMKVFGELVGGAMLDSQIENISDSFDAMENVPAGLQTTSDAAGNVTYVYAPDSLASESNLDANDYAKFANSITSQGGEIVGLDASGNVVATKPDGTTVRSQAGGNSVNFNITDVVTKEFGDQGDPAPSQDLSTNVTDYLDIDDTFETPVPDIPDIDSTYTSSNGNDGSDSNNNTDYSPVTDDEIASQQEVDDSPSYSPPEDIDSTYTSSNGNDGSDGGGNSGGSTDSGSSAASASDNDDSSYSGYMNMGGYVPPIQSITQGMSMGNVTKFTQKDRYGNMLSIEFDVPKQMEIPHPGQPIGTDTVPAWLTPGERVMNAEAERMYGPILKEMNDQGRALQAAQGGTIPEYAASGCKVQYEYDGGPVYAQEGLSPEQMSELLANQVLSGALDPRIAENALANIGMGRGQAQAVTPSFALPTPPPTDYEADATMGVRSYPQVPTSPQTLNTELPPIRPQQVPTPTDYEGDIFSGMRNYPEVPTTPGTLNAEPPQKVDDRMLSLRSLLLKQEDIKNKPYKDTEGNWTVGIGHKITDKEVIKQLDRGTMPINYDDNQVMGLFDKDIETAVKGAKQNFSGFNSYSNDLQDALVSMNFQLGTEGTRKFKDFRSALAKGDYNTAKAELDDSDWAKQTPSRVEYLKAMIDQEASGRVGNKNTITSTSGQPVVDSRFGVESTYQPKESGLEEDLSIPQQFRQWAFGDPRSLQERWDGDMSIPENVRNFVTGDPRSLPERVEGSGGILDNILNDTPEKQQARRDNFTLRDDALAVKENELLQELDVLEGQKQGRVGGATVPRPEQEIQSELAEVRQTRNQLKTGLVSGMDGPEEDELQVTPPPPPEVPEASEGADIPAKPKAPDVTDKEKSEAAQSLITKGEGGGEPTQDPKEVKSNSTKATPEQKSEAKSFFDEWGLSDLFDKKEIGTMMALYLGSRALGYSHNGSLNFAAKNYVTSVQKKALTASAAKAEREKAVRTMIADGKITPKAGAAYVRTGNLAYLDAGSGKGTSTGDFKTYYKNGKQYRAEKIKFPNNTESWVLGNGDIIDHTYHEDAWRVPNTKEYNDTRAKFVKDNRATFESVIKNAKGDEENVSWTKSMASITPDKAARDFWSWAASTGRDPNSDATLQIRDSAFRQLIKDAKKEKFQITSLEPYLESELYRENSGRPDLFMLNLEAVNENKATPKFVDQDKMNTLFNKIDRVARMSGRYEGQPSLTIRQDMFNRAVAEWTKEDNKQIVDIYKDADTPDEGTTGFYKFVDYLLDVQQNKLSQNTQ